MAAASWFSGALGARRALAAAGAVAVALALSACGSAASQASAQDSPDVVSNSGGSNTAGSDTSVSASASASHSLSAAEKKYCADATTLLGVGLPGPAFGNPTLQQFLAGLDALLKEAPAGVRADIAQLDQNIHDGDTNDRTDNIQPLTGIYDWDNSNCPS